MKLTKESEKVFTKIKNAIMKKGLTEEQALEVMELTVSYNEEKALELFYIYQKENAMNLSRQYN